VDFGGRIEKISNLLLAPNSKVLAFQGRPPFCFAFLSVPCFLCSILLHSKYHVEISLRVNKKDTAVQFFSVFLWLEC